MESRPLSHDPDVELLGQIARGDAAAMRGMVARKLPRLLALARRVLGNAAEAEDVAQESFIRVWREAGRWQARDARFDTWLHRVALNLCYDRLRRRREHTMAVLPDEADSAPQPDETVLQLEKQAGMEAALQALPQRQREALVLCYYQELSNIDAAQTMEISVDALESLLSRARRALRGLLPQVMDDAHER
uniref:RNA polymerase sigma factor n=1 Tax=uncultured bacterium BLR8 TaxID=506524 RepID=C0IN78_9BACT|nr:RNA polymerase sigma factor RpoE [uncultured bacterium BLR8]